MKALVGATVQNSSERSDCLDAIGLTLGMSISACPLIFCCRSRVIFYWRNRITAGVPMELRCSIVPAGDDQIDEDLGGLDDLAKSIGNPSGGPMWMCNCSREWFCLKLLRRMIAKTISKVSTNWTNDWPTDWTNQPIKPTIDRSRSTNKVIENNGLARLGDFSESRNQLRRNWLNDYNHRQYRRWYWMRSGVGQKSRSRARGPELARSQKPTVGALKIQEVDIGR